MLVWLSEGIILRAQAFTLRGLLVGRRDGMRHLVELTRDTRNCT